MNLNEDDILMCQKAFSEHDEDGLGAIKTQELGAVLEKLGFQLDDKELYKLIYEVDEKNTGMIDFGDFLTLYRKYKYAGVEDDNQDVIDAFVAIGGNEDLSGHVDAQKVIEIVKKEFQLTIDIEKLIAEVDADGSGEIEFDEFKTLLTNNNQASGE